MSPLDRPDVRDVVGLVVPSEPRSVGVIRRFAVQACAELGLDDCADTVALLVSEVATNAVLHAYGREVRVRIAVHGGRLRVEVDDSSPEMPVGRGAEDGDQDGRGLALVAALSDLWGVRAQPGGKTFWFELEP